MKKRVFAAMAGIGLLLLAQGATLNAAEIKVMCASPVEEVMKELGGQFERATGHRLLMQYDVAPVLKRRIDAGETFDVAILLPPLIDDLIKQGRVAAGTRAGVARSGMGVGVREGAPRPDISSAEALGRTLRNAKSIAYSAEGASGVAFLRLIERLGIAGEIKPRLKPTPGDRFAQVVPSGEAEMIVVPISAIMAPGMQLVGPVPEELQTYFLFTAGISASANEVEAAKALITFLTAPAAAPVLKAKGMEPGTP
jgi:molybdate transport system substrate-binding protein